MRSIKFISFGTIYFNLCIFHYDYPFGIARLLNWEIMCKIKRKMIISIIICSRVFEIVSIG